MREEFLFDAMHTFSEVEARLDSVLCLSRFKRWLRTPKWDAGGATRKRRCLGEH